jgi:hypothetical protein
MEDADVVHFRILLSSLQQLIKIPGGFAKDVTKMRNNPSYFVTCK